MIKHWQGKLPLPYSLLLIFIGLFLLIIILEPFLLKTIFLDPNQRIKATYISLIITRCIIFPWQLIGLLRATEKYFITKGSLEKTRFIQLLMLTSIVFTMIYSIELIQSAQFNKHQLLNSKEEPNNIGYTLTVNNDGQQLLLSGDIEIGITQAVESLLKENPTILSVRLESPGGQIYEGRGLSKLFTKYQLNTYSYGECSSACASAFIGGVKRFLGQYGKLGFHQYRQDISKYPKAVPFHNLIEEQNHDLELFKSQGVQQLFLDKVFNQAADGIWFPKHSELLEAGIIHGEITNN